MTGIIVKYNDGETFILDANGCFHSVNGLDRLPIGTMLEFCTDMKLPGLKRPALYFRIIGEVLSPPIDSLTSER